MLMHIYLRSGASTIGTSKSGGIFFGLLFDFSISISTVRRPQFQVWGHWYPLYVRTYASELSRGGAGGLPACCSSRAAAAAAASLSSLCHHETLLHEHVGIPTLYLSLLHL